MNRDTLRGVLAGGATFLATMVVAAGLAVGTGEIGGGPVPELGGWLRLELLAGAVASGLAGYVARRVAGAWRAVGVLAAGVLGLGLAEAILVLTAVSSGAVTVPTALVVLAPIVAAAGILVGGTRRSDLGALRRSSLRGVRFGRDVRALCGYAIPAFVLVVAAFLALFALPRLEGGPQSTVVASALTLDFTVALPALVYWFLVRSRRLPWIALLPAFVAGYVAAAATIPEAHHQLLDALRFVVIPAELVLVSWLGLRVRRGLAAAGEGDFATRFRIATREALGHRIPADVLTTEVAILHHAFRPIGRHRDEGGFTVHREIGYAGVVVGLTMAVLVEAVALHALLSQWSSTAAWVLSGLSLYAVVWLIGDFRAFDARPIRLRRTHLSLRIGLRWEVEIPLDAIAGIGGSPGPAERPSPNTLSATVLGRPNVRLRLVEPMEVIGLYGLRRRVDEIWLRVDEAAELRRMLAARLPDAAMLTRGITATRSPESPSSTPRCRPSPEG